VQWRRQDFELIAEHSARHGCVHEIRQKSRKYLHKYNKLENWNRRGIQKCMRMSGVPTILVFTSSLYPLPTGDDVYIEITQLVYIRKLQGGGGARAPPLSWLATPLHMRIL